MCTSVSEHVNMHVYIYVCWNGICTRMCAVFSHHIWSPMSIGIQAECLVIKGSSLFWALGDRARTISVQANCLVTLGPYAQRGHVIYA